MLRIREIMHCKPGKVRPLVDKFLMEGYHDLVEWGRREIYKVER